MNKETIITEDVLFQGIDFSQDRSDALRKEVSARLHDALPDVRDRIIFLGGIAANTEMERAPGKIRVICHLIDANLRFAGGLTEGVRKSLQAFFPVLQTFQEEHSSYGRD